jgi:hypothetical protein
MAHLRFSVDTILASTEIDGDRLDHHKKVLSRGRWDWKFKVEQRVWIRDWKRVLVSGCLPIRSLVRREIHAP